MKMKKSYSIVIGLLSILLIHTEAFSAAREKITADNADIVGAGATFPAPLYQRWIKEYGKYKPDISIFYDAVGSGEGTKRFMAHSVDFGASDSAMTDKQIDAMDDGVQLIPATAGIIVLAYNIPDVTGELKLSREVYADIFLGKIRYWNDPRIVELNKDLNLPKLNIVTITRSDSSGTTWAFTNHLSRISRDWKLRGPGVGKKLDWPGNSMSSRYNEGVATRIRHSWGSIGYVEYGVAKRAGLHMASLENKAGNFIKPTAQSGTVTLANTAKNMPENLRMFLPNPDGETSYPIITYSWLLLYKKYADKEKSKLVKEFVQWGLGQGQSYAPEYGYTPLPEDVVSSASSGLNSVY